MTLSWIIQRTQALLFLIKQMYLSLIVVIFIAPLSKGPLPSLYSHLYQLKRCMFYSFICISSNALFTHSKVPWEIRLTVIPIMESITNNGVNNSKPPLPPPVQTTIQVLCKKK